MRKGCHSILKCHLLFPTIPEICMYKIYVNCHEWYFVSLVTCTWVLHMLFIASQSRYMYVGVAQAYVIHHYEHFHVKKYSLIFRFHSIMFSRHYNLSYFWQKVCFNQMQFQYINLIIQSSKNVLMMCIFYHSSINISASV